MDFHCPAHIHPFSSIDWRRFVDMHHSRKVRWAQIWISCFCCRFSLRFSFVCIFFAYAFCNYGMFNMIHMETCTVHTLYVYNIYMLLHHDNAMANTDEMCTIYVEVNLLNSYVRDFARAAFFHLFLLLTICSCTFPWKSLSNVYKMNVWCLAGCFHAHINCICMSICPHVMFMQ